MQEAVVQKQEGRESSSRGSSERATGGLRAACSPSRASLRGLDFAAGESALAPPPPPGAAPVQRKVEDEVSNLDALSSTSAAEAESYQWTPGALEKNTVKKGTPLPWTPTGWDTQVILTKLGQYDQVAGTDSDAKRCVQSVALASRLVSGPAATIAFLEAAMAQAMSSGVPTKRQVAAIGVLKSVKAQIAARKATYDDLSWAQEALHDASFGDKVGTPEARVGEAVVPDGDKTKLEKMSVWCTTPEQVLAQANALADKQQLLVCDWLVLFNARLDAGEDEGEVDVKGEDGKVVRHSISRIDAAKKPEPSEIDEVRDNKNGHQLLIYKDGSKLWFYDPELTSSGKHLQEVGKDASSLKSVMKDQPKFEQYKYMQILGKLTPT